MKRYTKKEKRAGQEGKYYRKYSLNTKSDEEFEYSRLEQEAIDYLGEIEDIIARNKIESLKEIEYCIKRGKEGK